MIRILFLTAALSLAFSGAASSISAQQVNISTPFITSNDSFYEQIGTNFGFTLNPHGLGGGGSSVIGLDPFGNPTMGGGINFTQGSAGAAVPPFGGVDPNANAQVGFGISGGPISMTFGLTAGQGSQRSIVSQVPNVTIPNGGTGTFADTSQTPFVTGVVPVVGVGYVPTRLPIAAAFFPPVPTYGPSPLDLAVQRIKEDAARGVGQRLGAPIERRRMSPQERAAVRAQSAPVSSAERGDLSVAAILQQRAARVAEEEAAQQAELDALIERARGAAAAGKMGAARIYYRQAASRATGEQKNAILTTLQDLSE